MAAVAVPDEEECYLWAILSDPSGLDQAEFMVTDETTDDGCFRAWPFQWAWWRNTAARQIEQGSRSSGKSLSVRFRALAFPFIHAGQEMVVTAPEGNHLDALTDNIENVFVNNRLASEMLVGGRNGIKHRPFHCVAEGQLVLTSAGYVPIEAVKVGDLVLTHKNRWRPVEKVWDNGIRDVVSLKGAGHTGLRVTPDHEILCTKIKQKSINNPNGTRRTEWQPQPPVWETPKNWRLKEPIWRWASPSHFDAPDVEVPSNFRINKQGFGVGMGAEIPVLTEDFLWFVGHYVAEGCTWQDKLSVLSIHTNEVDDVTSRLARLGISYYVQDKYRGTNAAHVRISNMALAEWLVRFVPGDSHSKQVPMWVFGLDDKLKRAFLDGYLYGDGYWTVLGHNTPCTVSRGLVYSLKLLAHSLEVGFGVSSVPAKESIMKSGHVIHGGPSFDMYFNFDPPEKKAHTKTKFYDGFAWTAASKCVPDGQAHVYDLTVKDDHSYVVEGVVVHNCNFRNGARIMGRIPQRDGKGVKGIHPIWLELDEGQDYPEAGWLEIIETVKRGDDRAQWRAHGVTRGVRDKFYEYTQPDSGWEVHHYPAMYRPTWNEEERREKVQLYGNRDSPDYRRNVLGLHGDAQSPLFVLHRLMEAVDADQSSDYNLSEYWEQTIDEATVRDNDGNALALLNPPLSHSNYKRIWIGADIGYTQAPTAIVIFAEQKPTAAEMAERNQLAVIAGVRGSKKVAKTELKLIGRIMLKRVAHENQVQVIMWLIDHYRPQAFAMDRTGLGLPLFQDIQNHVRQNDRLKFVLDRIKGYNFSEKLVVDFDDVIEIDENDPKGYEKAEIKRNVLEYSSDVLRSLVDDGQIRLPWDKELIGEFRGQTWTYDKSTIDMYGRRKMFSAGSFHTLDGCRMAVLAWKQAGIEQFFKAQEDTFYPSDAIILDL